MANAGVKVLKVVSRDRCIGCFSCMYACSRILRRHGGTNKSALRIRQYTGLEGAFSLRVCSRCETPDCAAACPQEALSVARGGGVRLKAALCIQCRKCVKACGIAALQWNEREKLPIPCIQCGQCAKYCPNEVLAIVERPVRETTEVFHEVSEPLGELDVVRIAALSGQTEKTTTTETKA
jgi:Fe-S-cluster-containing dehydrogenase component